MTVRDRQRGSALTATLAATAVLLPLAAFAVLLTRLDFYVHDNTRAQAEVFYVAEAGLEHALADIPRGESLEQLLTGPDGYTGSADDGVFPFREGSPGSFPRAPFGYQVRVERVNSQLLRLTSVGSGARHARATVEALVAADSAPYVPAALYAPGVRAIAIGDFQISGFDRSGTDTPALPALGVDSAETASTVRSNLSADASSRLVGDGGSPSIAEVDSIGLPALIQTFGADGRVVRIDPATLPSPAQLGTADQPQLTILVGDPTLTGSVQGAGVLVAPNGLVVEGSLTFEGLVLVGGDTTVGASSEVYVDGALWVDGVDVVLAFAGRGAIISDRAAVRAADLFLPGVLPHSIVLRAWRELL